MKASLIATLRKYGNITDNDEAAILAHATIRHYQKGEDFLSARKVATEIGFLVEGVFRYYTIDREGKEHTFTFIKEGEFFTNLTSYHEGLPSYGTIQAETDAEVIVLDKTTWEYLSETIKDWEYISKRLSQVGLINHLQFLRQLISHDATYCYLRFLERFPTIANRVPAQHLASFMGITKHSLSRIRKKIADKKP